MIFGPWDLLNYHCFIAAFLLVGFRLSKIHWSVSLAFLASFASAVCASHGGIFSNLNMEFLNYLKYLPSYSMLVACVFVIGLKDINPRKLLKLFGLVNIINSLVVIWEFIGSHDGFTSGGFLLNSSMNSAFIATTIPFVPMWAIPIMCAAVILSKASVPVAVMGVVLAAMFVRIKDHKWWLVGSAWITAIAAYFTPNLLSGSGRYAQWAASWHMWHDKIDHILGCGAGTYYLLGSFISYNRGMHDGLVFTFMHNDWFQILFECGIAGLISCVIMLGYALYYSRKNPAIFASICGYSVFALVDMPLRYIATSAMCFILLNAAFENRNEALYADN